MQISEVQKQLNDLPKVFKPKGKLYAQVMVAFLGALAQLGLNTETLKNQLSLNTAIAAWLNFWGLLYGVPRSNTESDADFYARINATLLAEASTVAGIGKFIKQVFGYDVVITENLTTNSYSIAFNLPLTNAQLTAVAVALNRVRPAGVPFLPFAVVAGGMVLNTTFFLGMSQAQGAYLISPTAEFYPTIPASTNSLIVQLPLSYLNLPTNFPT